MRGFIVLCLSAVALAAPQGYNYNPAGGASGFGGQSISSGSSSFSSSLGSLGGSSTGIGGFGGAGFGSSGQSGSVGGFFQNGAHGGYSNQGGQQEAVITKRFFIHSAPEENDEDHKERHITVGTPKKNYNVVFIKAPSKSSKKTTLKITPAANEEKTVVYVLTKKSDGHDLHTEVLEQPSATSKPEVFFIKYNTKEEAQHAQEQIQAQYDALGGSSQVTDEGVAPISSVIGSLGGHGGAGAGSASSSSSGSAGYSSGLSGNAGYSSGPSIGHASGNSGHANNAYLPPAFRN